jgi:hypothetical protein
VASTNNSLPQNDHGEKTTRGDVGIALQACKRCGEIGHLSRNCSRKRERFPTTMVEYEENEVRDLLALEISKKMIKKKDNSKVL